MRPGSAGSGAGFWCGRRVLVTGHTGFKGAWLSLWLERLGAEVSGLALAPPGDPNLFELLRPALRLSDHRVDLRDAKAVSRVVEQAAPEIVFHMAAQSLVRESLLHPVETVSTNVLGTAHLLDALRSSAGLRAVVVVTSDKVYANDDSGRAYGEDARLGGDDPYSASKSACELIAHAWAASFLEAGQAALATARAGNVIGGGDWAKDRLIPDLWRAASRGERVRLRYPRATRPWQHVLDPLAGYLMYAHALFEGARNLPRALNFGPMDPAPPTVAAIAGWFSAALGVQALWEPPVGEQPPEKMALSVNPERAAATLGWQPQLDFETAVRWTAQWYRAMADERSMVEFSNAQIDRYATLVGHALIEPAT